MPVRHLKRASTGCRWGWVLLGAAAYGLHLAFGKDSPFVENVYSRGVFIGLRWLWDRTFGLSPLPLIYVIPMAILLWGVLRITRGRVFKEPVSGPAFAQDPLTASAGQGRARLSAPKKAARGLLLIASWAGALVLFFYVLWGFNYNRVGLEKQLDLEVQPLDPAARQGRGGRNAARARGGEVFDSRGGQRCPRQRRPPP